jgi:hypothetical protein
MYCSRVLHEDRSDLDNLFKADAKVSGGHWFLHGGMRFDQHTQIYVCGSSKVAIGVKRSLIEHIRLARGYSLEEAGDAFERMTKGRYATDIFE